MEPRAKFLGHPIHQMLIVFPLGLLATAVVFDIVYLLSGDPDMSMVSYWMMAAGIIGGLLAAPFGWLDWSKIPKATRAKRIGLIHGVGNVIVVLLFLMSWLLRSDSPADPSQLEYILSFSAGGLALFTGWLGGELVDRLGIGVSDIAGVEAPSSLRVSRRRT